MQSRTCNGQFSNCSLAPLTGVIRLAASLSLTPLLVLARRRTLYLLSGLATILSLAAFSTVLYLSDKLNHREGAAD